MGEFYWFGSWYCLRRSLLGGAPPAEPSPISISRHARRQHALGPSSGGQAGGTGRRRQHAQHAAGGGASCNSCLEPLMSNSRALCSGHLRMSCAAAVWAPMRARRRWRRHRRLLMGPQVLLCAPCRLRVFAALSHAATPAGGTARVVLAGAAHQRGARSTQLLRGLITIHTAAGQQLRTSSVSSRGSSSRSVDTALLAAGSSSSAAMQLSRSAPAGQPEALGSGLAPCLRTSRWARPIARPARPASAPEQPDRG